MLETHTIKIRLLEAIPEKEVKKTRRLVEFL